MLKKTLTKVVAAAALALGVAGFAFAGTANLSKVSDDLYTASTSVDGVTVSTKTSTANAAANKLANDVITDIKRLVAQNSSNAFQVMFGDEAMDAVGKALGITGTAAENLEINEVAPFKVTGWTSGDLKVTLSFPTVYKAGAKLAVKIGSRDSLGQLQWKTYEATANDKGAVEFTMDEASLKDLVNEDTCIVVFNRKGDVDQAKTAAKK